MKKNKPVTIALLIAVIAIWGTIAYKIVQATGNNKINNINHIQKTDSGNTPLLLDDYTISDYTKDPFLDILTDTAAVPETIIKPAPQPDKKPILIPEYYGMIQNEKDKTAILKIKDKYIFMHKGEKHGDVKLVSMHEENVVLMVEGEKVTVDLRKKYLRKIFEPDNNRKK